MTTIDDKNALQEIKLLNPRHGDILIFHLHRRPVAEDALVVQRILRQTKAQVLIFLLGPGDSVEQLAEKDEAGFLAHGLKRVPPVKPVNTDYPEKL